MTSYKIRQPNLLYDPRLKRVDRHVVRELLKNDTNDAAPHIRVANGITRGEWNGDSDDRRIGNVVDNMRFEWHYDYKPIKAAFDVIQNYVNVIRYQILWYQCDTETFNMDANLAEIFTLVGANGLDIHNPLNVDKLASGELISFYDRTFTVAPLQYGNNTEQALIEDPPVWQIYSVMADKNIAIDEGSLDLSKYYHGGLRTVYGSTSEFDIQSGILLEVWRTKYNAEKINVEGYHRLWFLDA